MDHIVEQLSRLQELSSDELTELADAFDRGDIREAQRIAAQLVPLVHALNGDGFQAVMAKAALKVKGYIPCAAMRLPNVEANAEQYKKVEDGMRAAGLL